MIFPTVSDLVNLNRHLIEKYGGDFFGVDNIQNPSSLEWMLGAIQSTLFGFDPYPTVEHKAALIAWKINTAHVFNDGNKRTSMFASILFLDDNGFNLEVTSYEIKQIALFVATTHQSGYSYEQLVEWYRLHIVPLLTR